MTAHLGSCVLCQGTLGDFGREVYMRLHGAFRMIGYACRDCTQRFASDDDQAIWPARVLVEVLR